MEVPPEIDKLIHESMGRDFRRIEAMTTNERTTMEVTSPVPYTCKHGCERDLLMQAFADEANLRITTAQTEAAASAARVAELEAEVARLREAGNAMRDKLLGFVGALALHTDCGPDVDTIKAWERL